jgi:hypothetical protein
LAEANGRVEARFTRGVAHFWEPWRRHWRPEKRKALMVPDVELMQRVGQP